MSARTIERRRARRMAVSIPTEVESVGRDERPMPAALARVYERVDVAALALGTFPGVICDLSANGAFITGEPLPLAARVAFGFAFPGAGRVEAIGWVLWRRRDVCEIPGPRGAPLRLPKGFGVLFEALPLDARLVIHRAIEAAASR